MFPSYSLQLVGYQGSCGSPTVDLASVTILLNFVISNPRARFMGIDLKNFALYIYMPCLEFTWIAYDTIPQEIKYQYNVSNIQHNVMGAPDTDN